jgi:hypothetical protein
VGVLLAAAAGRLMKLLAERLTDRVPPQEPVAVATIKRLFGKCRRPGENPAVVQSNGVSTLGYSLRLCMNSIRM